MGAELRVGIDGDDAAVHLAVAEVDHILLAVLAGVQALGRVEFAAVRRHERDRAHVRPEGLCQISDRGGVAGDDIVEARGDLHRAVADDHDGARVARVGLVRRVDLRVRLGLRFGRLLPCRFCRIGLVGLRLLLRIVRRHRCGVGRRFGRCFLCGFLHPGRSLLICFLHGVERFAAVRGGVGLVHDEHAVLAGAGVIVEFIERPIRVQQRLAAREGIGIILLERRDIRPVQQRADGKFRPDKLALFRGGARRVLIGQRIYAHAEQRGQQYEQEGRIEFFHRSTLP